MSQTGTHLLDTTRPALPGALRWRRRSQETTGLPRAAGVVAEVALSLGALLGAGVMGITLFASHAGMSTLVVRSGSMEPTIPTGSMVLVQRIDATDVKVGDIVAVERPDHTRVTHRVLALEPKGESVELTLKGDANEDPDPVPVTVRQAYRLVWQAPVIGRTVAWLATAQGSFVLGCIATLVALHMLGRRPLPGWRRSRRPVAAGDG